MYVREILEQNYSLPDNTNTVENNAEQNKNQALPWRESLAGRADTHGELTEEFSRHITFFRPASRSHRV